MDLDKKLQDTLEVFSDLQNLYAYEEDTRGVLRQMYDNTLEVLHNPDINVKNLVDDQGNTLLHLAAHANHIEYFIKAAHKGIDPYIQNSKNRNAFYSRHYEFANTLWKSFEHVYFSNTVKDKSFEKVTQEFHLNFKQKIYENNIKNNKFDFNIQQICQFLKQQNIYSHNNVLMFAFDKFDSPLAELLEFVIEHEKSLSSENNSLALHCALKHLQFKNTLSKNSHMLDMFMNNADFAVNQHFLQSMQISASNYHKSGFDNILHKQTSILINNNYNIKEKFNFYYQCSHKQNNKEIHSVDNLEQLYQVYNLQSVYNYYKIDFKLQEKNNATVIKRLKI